MAIERCPVCSEIKCNLFGISANILGKNLPNVISELTGTQVSPRDVENVYVCEDCVVAIIQAQTTKEKLYRFLQETGRAGNQETTGKPKDSLEFDLEVKSNNLANGDGVAVPIEGPDSTLKAATNKNVTKKSNPKKKTKKSVKDLETTSFAIDKKSLDGQMNKIKRKLENDSASVTMDITSNDNSKINKSLSIRKKVVKSQPVYDFKCHICEFASTSPVQFKSHLITAHQMDNMKIFKCANCEKSFEKAVSLKLHFTKIHVNKAQREYLCTTPSLSSPRPVTPPIEEHPLSYTNCEFCGKKCLIGKIGAHMNKFHEKEEHNCANCGATFHNNQKLQAHILSDRCKNATHACEFENCQRRYGKLSKMYAHMKKKHGYDVNMNIGEEMDTQ